MRLVYTARKRVSMEKAASGRQFNQRTDRRMIDEDRARLDEVMAKVKRLLVADHQSALLLC